MKSLEDIKNDYAVSVGYNDWLDLELHMYGTAKQISKHWYNVCILSQKECLKSASENALLGWEFIPFEDYSPYIDKESITNENNIIK